MHLIKILLLFLFLKLFNSKKIIKGQFGNTIHEYEYVQPILIDHDGNYLSNNLSSDHNEVHYKININNKNYHLEMKQNKRFVTSGANRNKCISNDKTDCHYSGSVKGVKNSNVALSNCNGLTGFIEFNDNVYLIEPLLADEFQNFEEKPMKHLLYQYHTIIDGYHESGYLIPDIKRNRKADQEENIGHLKQMYLELLIVLDQSLIEFHKEIDLENYILTVINMAHTVYHDASLGAPIELNIVRIIHLSVEDDQLNIKISHDGPKVLDAFKAWAKRINPPSDEHPYHHDLAILITRVDICMEDDKNCGLLGLANLGSTCDSDESALILEDCGLKLGFTMAHEIGHSLGMRHDSPDESGCNPQPYDDGFSVVMAKKATMKTRGWSLCSREYLYAFIDSGFATCLYDKSEPNDIQFTQTLPGTMYGQSYQCKTLFGVHVDECPDVASECENLKCFVQGQGCIETHYPLAPGTSCGIGKWCYDGQCISEGNRPGAIDGGWSVWSNWSDCSRTCGGGIQERIRECNNPMPANEGLFCVGARVEFQMCKLEKCTEGSESFRNLQCMEFRDWIYPEDNKKHNWTEYNVASEAPCALVCINDNQQVAILKNKVTDGTSCYKGINHICISGYCKAIPCDNILNGNAIEDACGICHGDGTTCNVEAVELHYEKKGFILVTKVPKGLLGVVVEELSPTNAVFVVKKGREIVVNKLKLGFTNVNGTMVWLGQVRHMQDILRITGPVTVPLTVWISVKDPVSVNLRILTKSVGRVGSYSWRHVDWTPCSAKCGPGVHYSIPKCIDSVNGLVDDNFCKVLKPEIMSRTCLEDECVPRWQVGEWSGCDCMCKDEIEERSVDCIVPIGETNAGIEIVSDKKCLPPKPMMIRKCKCPIKRGSTMENRKIKTINHHHNIIKEKITSLYNNLSLTKNEKCRSKAKLGLLVPPPHKHARKSYIKQLKLNRGTLIIDYENIDTMKFDLEVDDSNLGINEDFPIPIADNMRVSIKGSKVMKYLKHLKSKQH